MKYYLPGILLIGLGLLVGVTSTLVLIFMYDEVISILENTQNLAYVVFFLIAVTIVFIGLGIYVIYKDYYENARIERLNQIGERKLGVVKNLQYDPKHNHLYIFELEVVINENKNQTHKFMSDWISLKEYRIFEGNKVYVIYDKKNLKNYVIVYDKVKRD